MQVADCLKRASELTAVSDSPRLDAELLLCYVLGKDRTWLFTWPEKKLSSKSLAQFHDLLQRRINGEPIAHILGEREFWSLPLYVDNSTLIPRPDTELLVETVLAQNKNVKTILDLGTGTGAIALALASELKNASVVGVDQSAAAVRLAMRNQQRHKITNVRFIESDWFAALQNKTFDVIVSNPPYIDEQDPHLQQGDVRFEPSSALIAADQGIADIRFIVVSASGYLNAGGLLLIEHGWQQADSVQKLFVENAYQRVETIKDLSGNDRLTLGWK